MEPSNKVKHRAVCMSVSWGNLDLELDGTGGMLVGHYFTCILTFKDLACTVNNPPLTLLTTGTNIKQYGIILLRVVSFTSYVTYLQVTKRIFPLENTLKDTSMSFKTNVL